MGNLETRVDTPVLVVLGHWADLECTLAYSASEDILELMVYTLEYWVKGLCHNLLRIVQYKAEKQRKNFKLQ